MVLPQKTFRFFDLSGFSTGTWDPSLLLTFIGALGTNLVFYHGTRQIIAPTKPLLGESYAIPSTTLLDMNLIGGSALFGIGWGLSGCCPGPAIANIALGNPLPVAMIMLGTMSALFVKGQLSAKDLSPKQSNFRWLLVVMLIMLGCSVLITPPSPNSVHKYDCDTVEGGLFGGALIGSAVGFYLLLEGSILGFSNAIGTLVGGNSSPNKLPAFGVFSGVILSSLLLRSHIPVPAPIFKSTALTALGSFLTGFGTTIGRGCTSGHGIAGMARLSVRSIVATMTFMAGAAVSASVLSKLF